MSAIDPIAVARELFGDEPDIMSLADQLEQNVRAAIERHLPADQYQVLKAAEESEREQLRRWADLIAQGAPAP